MGCPGPSKSSSRAGESLIFMFFQFQLSTGTFGSTWSVLGASWAQLGASWAPLGLNLGALGTNLAPTWALLGPTWRQLGCCWNQVGTNLSPLWAIMGDLVTLLERSWSLLGASGPFKGDLGLILVPQEGFWRLRDTISTPTSLYFGLSGDRFWSVNSAATAHRKRIRQQCRIMIVESEITPTMQQQRK